VEDQTDLIRQLKHSKIFKEEIAKMLEIREEYKDDNDKIYHECALNCSFLFTYYTDIFNKIRKDEINIDILNKFVDILQQIEEGQLDQHDGSFLVGTLLKELYIDSALKKAEKLDEANEAPVEPRKAEVNISWKQYKASQS
jgi:hypothetical protein